MSKLSAKIFVLHQTACWLEDQLGEACSDILLDENGEYDQEKVAAAKTLVKRLFAQCVKLEAKISTPDL